MKEQLRRVSPLDLDQDKRSQLMLLVCDEGAISCATFRKLQEDIADSGMRTVLAIPDKQYQKGFRGWAKVQVLSSIVDQLEGVMPIDYETARQELGKNWAIIRINGPVTWGEIETITHSETGEAPLHIAETADPFDRTMIDRAKKVIETSNCWQDPAGCVFVKDGEVLIESASTSFNNSNCEGIPINFRELSLNSSERMHFCDSLHAERVGVAEASKRGISLEGTTAYLTKFPCRSCALSLISAGVRTIVFGQDSYGLGEVSDLFDTNKITLKRLTS